MAHASARYDGRKGNGPVGFLRNRAARFISHVPRVYITPVAAELSMLRETSCEFRVVLQRPTDSAFILHGFDLDAYTLCGLKQSLAIIFKTAQHATNKFHVDRL